MKLKTGILASASMMVFAAAAFTTASAPQNGVYRFTFGVSETQDGSIPVPASAVCDVNGTMEAGQFSYGFLGTTDDSYKNDVPSNLPTVPHAIDGFKVVKGQKIVLHDTTDANGVSCVAGPAASEYLPRGASSFEGRYPVRFSMRAEERAYYAVTCTVANASSTANADVTLFSERCHTHAQHLVLAPGETKTFAWSVELAPNYFKNQGNYTDNAINVVVVGENAALSSVTVVKQPTTSENAMVRGSSVDSMNTGKTIWLCDDSTGTDQRCETPYFALQNYAGVGSGLSRWAPADLSVRNQGEGGLASSDNAHLNTCLLKPGDYLYVQYGHNEKGTDNLGATDVYTNNLEKYLTLATSSQANLVIVSPPERRYTWDSTNNPWSRTLQAFATAGKAWVEDKIANGATNVAFLDLNERYSEWMNNELVRIHNVNSSVSLQDAIGFYYQCSKGGKVDSAHPNNAGADWGAYWVWKAAVDAVAAGANADEGTSAKIQANVLAGITDGVAARLAADEPWLVSNEIVNAGKASNAYWDYAVKAGYDYINSAAVAAVDATVSEGVATISGVKMRVLNQLNYAKAVIDVVSADGTATNRWYSYCNYDASGNVSGDIVVPEEQGFLSADLDKDVATTSSKEYSETLTVPVGAKAYIWFAEASGNTWQVGANGPVSAVYPFEAWTQVLLDDDCSDVATWTRLFGGVNTFSSDDGHITFSMTGFDSGTKKKNGGFAHKFADSATISEGRFRVSFKARYGQGSLVFALSNTEGTDSWPLQSGDAISILNGGASAFGNAVSVTLSADETPVPQSTINSDEWMDVDMIVDIDAGKVMASIGGSDYATYSIGTLSKTPYSWFGVTLASEKAHAGSIDDVKIVTLVPSPKCTVDAPVSNPAFGAVEINGNVAESISVVKGADVVLKAVCADPDLYKFVEWQDAGGNSVFTKQTFVIEDIAADCAYTAVFREYAHDENRITTWDFSDYDVSEIAATGNQTVAYNGMSIFLQNGDTITGDGICWANVTFNKESSVGSASGRHIEWTPAASGTATIVFQVGAIDTAKTQRPYLCVVEGDADMAPYAYYARAGDMVANADQTLTFNVTAGKLYKIYSFYYNRSSSVSIKSVAYSYAPTYITAAVAVNNANYGSAVVDGAAAAEVFSGREVTLVATPASSAYRFVNWTDGEENIVSTEATFTVPVSADVAYTANFEKVAAGDTVEMRYDFVSFAGSAASYTGVSTFDCGCFKFQMISGDSAGASGATWYKVAVDDKSALGTALSETGDHYIKFTAPYDGTVSFKTSVDSLSSKYKAVLYIKAAEAASACANSGDAKVDFTEANKVYTLSLDVTAGATYYVWAYSWNAGAGGYNPYITISSIIYSHASDPTTLTVSSGDATAGTVTVNDVAVAGTMDVQKGEYVHLVATPNAGGLFGGWKNDSEEIVSTETDFWLCVKEATSLTATWRTADTHAFTWNPSVASGNWNNSANWLYEGLVPASTYPSDSSQDVVTFDTEAAVNFPSAVEVSNIVLNASVAFSGQRLSLNNLDGEGVLTLNGMNIANNNDNTLKVNTDVAVAKGTTNTINIRSSNNWKGYINLNGNLSGEGIIDISIAGKSGVGITFAGDNRDFFGDINTTGGISNRNPVKWDKPEASGTNIFWNLEHSFRNDKDDGDMVNNSGTYRYGGYKGAWYKYNYADKFTLEIGSLDRNSSIDVKTYAKAPNITKVGTANLTLGTKTIKNLTVSEGSVTMPVGIAPQTLTIAEGAKIIIVGDATWEENTTTNLFSYTTLAGTGASSLASQIELTGLAANLGAEFTIDAENKKVVATIVKKATPEPSTVAVFLTGGQSNTEGRIPNSDLPAYLATNGRALVSDHSTVSDSTELGTFAPWAPTGKWAYDTEVYYQIAQALGTEFYVVKTSYGGTSISPGVNNSPSAHDNAWLSGYGAGYHWSANADFLAATASAGRTFVKDGVTYDGQSMLKAWIENIDAALDALVADNKTPDVKAIIWHQGESDNNNGNYASDLTAVVTYIRQHIATKLQNDDYLNLPFFCGNIPRRSSLFKAGLDRNFTTIEETANNNMHVVDIYDLTMLSDSKHFDAASAITFGKRLFNRMIDEGVMEGEKVEVEDCVRAPDFGLEQVVNNTTTWTWDGMSGDIATSLTNICGVYFHAQNSNNRKVRFNDVAKTVAWTIGGDKTPTEVSGGAYCVAYADNSGTLTATSTAGDSSCGSYMVAVNVGRSGSFEVFYVAGKAGTIKLYLNGREIDSTEATVGKVSHLAGTNTGKGVYYIALGQGTIIGARFVPDEEMPLVTLTIGVDRWTTFGNLYESNFRLPNGVKAYAVSAVDDDPTLLARSKVGAVNIGDAVVVKGPPGTYTLESGEGAAYGGENLMVVQKETEVLAPTSGSDFFNFEFSVQGGKPIFVRAQGDRTLEAGKAFFSITEGDEHAQQSKLRFREQPGLVVIFL